MMDPIKKATWIAALRSGKYEQCPEVLHAGGNKFCCLGVNLKVVAGLEPNRSYVANADKYVNASAGSCFSGEYWTKVLEAQGVDVGSRLALIDMNDSGKTFNEIADWIDANL